MGSHRHTTVSYMDRRVFEVSVISSLLPPGFAIDAVVHAFMLGSSILLLQKMIMLLTTAKPERSYNSQIQACCACGVAGKFGKEAGATPVAGHSWK